MDLRTLLALLDAHGAELALDGDRLKLTGPDDVVDSPTVGTTIRQHRDLLRAHLIGRVTGQLLAFCSSCGEPTMTAAFTSDRKRRKTWPTCRVTHGCQGRHEPRDVDVETWRAAGAPAPPKQAKPHPKVDDRVLLGPRPTWPYPPGVRQRLDATWRTSP